MGSIKNWIVQRFLLGWLKEQFDKLPLDGKKTVLGVIILVLDLLLKAFPEYGVYVSAALEILKQLPFDVIVTSTGIGAVVVGALHKILKYFGKEQAPEAPNVVELTRH